MTTQNSDIIDIYKNISSIKDDLVSIANLNAILANNMNDLKAKLTSHEANIVLLLSLVKGKYTEDEFFEHLKFISTSNDYTADVNLAASKFLEQKALWLDWPVSKC